MTSTIRWPDPGFAPVCPSADGASTPTDPEASRWWDPPGQLRGLNLRSWLVLQLADTHGSMTVAQLVERLATSDLVAGDRASKAISDALRWEIRRGRVVRLERGRYTLGRLARSTQRRMRGRTAACHRRALAAASDVQAPTAGSWPRLGRIGVRRALGQPLSGSVVAPTRTQTINMATISTLTTCRPQPRPPPGRR